VCRGFAAERPIWTYRSTAVENLCPWGVSSSFDTDSNHLLPSKENLVDDAILPIGKENLVDDAFFSNSMSSVLQRFSTDDELKYASESGRRNSQNFSILQASKNSPRSL